MTASLKKAGSENTLHSPPPTPWSSRPAIRPSGCSPPNSAAHSYRLLAFPRPSKQALTLLSQGLIHVAGIHLARVGRHEQNRAAAKEKLRGGFCMLRGASWQEGLAMASGFQFQNVKSAVQSRARWVGREAGSAARELLDELLVGRPAPRQIAYGHRGVAEAIRCGWADIGICLRLVSDEAGLGFLTDKCNYFLCFFISAPASKEILSQSTFSYLFL